MKKSTIFTDEKHPLRPTISVWGAVLLYGFIACTIYVYFQTIFDGAPAHILIKDGIDNIGINTLIWQILKARRDSADHAWLPAILDGIKATATIITDLILNTSRHIWHAITRQKY